MKKTIKEWAKIYEEETGKILNLGSLRKRRAVSGLGELVPPRQYILTRGEFNAVMWTPLPMCNQVIGKPEC